MRYTSDNDAAKPIEHVIIAFDTTSAAFREPMDGEADNEWAARESVVLLTTLIRKVVEEGLDEFPLLDTNGHVVGVVTLTRAKEAPRTQWTTQELQKDFTVLGFSMGFVVLERKSDGAKGSMTFSRVGNERIYTGWQEDKP